MSGIQKNKPAAGGAKKAKSAATARSLAAGILSGDLEKIKEKFEAATARLADPRDKGLLKELVYGTLRRQISLDDLLTRASGHKVFRVDPKLAPILRIAAFQLIHLDKIPPHAAVDEAVELAKAAGGAKRAGFVNAVLRNLLRRREEFVAAQAAIGGLQGSALRAGYPQWLLDRWAQDLGGAARAAALAEAFNRPHPLLLTPLKNGLEPPPGAEPAPLGTFRYEAGAGRAGLEQLGGGEFYAADLASVAAAAAVAAALESAPPGPLLDACAAPGGKSILLRKFLTGAGPPLIAMDQQRERLALMHASLQCGADMAKNIFTLGGDAAAPPFKPDMLAAVWLDAPCSAAGTLRKAPEKRHILEPEAPTLYAARQRELLAAASGLIRPGGLLIYSVCSPFAAEGLEVVADFRAVNLEFTPLPLTGAAAELPWEASGDGWLALPDRADWEGFFLAILRRQG